ncbi:unnamed protein product, partial [Effrenium voratum]
MVVVRALEPQAWNESAPGAPWGGQSTIWDAYRDLTLATKGRFQQPDRFKTRRLVFELGESAEAKGEVSRPGPAQPRSATMRRLVLWPTPTFDSSCYKAMTQRSPEPIPPLPTAYGRLDDEVPQPPRVEE